MNHVTITLSDEDAKYAVVVLREHSRRLRKWAADQTNIAPVCTAAADRVERVVERIAREVGHAD